MDDKNAVLVPGTLGPLAPAVQKILAEQGRESKYLGDITPEDIDAGFAHIDNDVCLATVSLVGQYVRYFKDHDAAGAEVLAPELCRECRSVSLPSVLPTAFARAGIEGVKIVPFSSEDVARAATSSEEGALDETKPVIGVCGNVPISTIPELNHVVTDYLRQSGCEVVMPPLSVIANKRDFLTPALAYFDEHHITSVICLLPFGCMGGHVFARGQLRKMRELFPNIELTILDYDTSASDINLVNRTELVIQTAREKAQALA